MNRASVPSLQFPYRIGVGPVKARLLEAPSPSRPTERKIAFSAFTRVYVHDFESGGSQAVSPAGLQAFHPAWSPDGRNLAFVSWGTRGGHVWRMRADGRGQPRRLSENPAFYSDPVWSPDGSRIVALRAASYDRLYRENDFGAPVGSDLVWMPAAGGPVSLIMPSRGHGAPHFGPESDRVYVYASGGLFGSVEASGLISIRFDGTDRRTLLKATGPGIYFADEPVPAADVRVAPDGAHALVHHANQLYLLRLLNPYANDLTVNLGKPSLPLARLTDIGADFFGWSGSGAEFFWSTGHSVHRRNVADVSFEEKTEDEEPAAGDADADTDASDAGESESDPVGDSTEEGGTPDAEGDDERSDAENGEGTTRRGRRTAPGGRRVGALVGHRDLPSPAPPGRQAGTDRRPHPDDGGGGGAG